MRQIRCIVAGTYQISDAYPNVRYKIDALEKIYPGRVTKVNARLTARINYESAFHKLTSSALLLMQLLVGSFSFLVSVIRHRKREVLYVPYPAVHLLFLVGLLPSALKPRVIVADAFISIYDTVVIDRSMLKESGIAAKLLWRFERRAFASATQVLTDTPENSAYYSQLFELPGELFTDIPLSINNAVFQPCAAGETGSEVFKVLFVGNMVPLHNIGLLCDAIGHLDRNLDIEFTVVGHGQESPVFENFHTDYDWANCRLSCRWIKDWQDSESVAGLIAEADLCIGILGAEGKSHRVWPFKNYLYLACGKPLVTAATAVTKRLAQNSTSPPFLVVEPVDAQALAAVISSAFSDRAMLAAVSSSALELYQQHFSAKQVESSLEAIIENRLDLLEH